MASKNEPNARRQPKGDKRDRTRAALLDAVRDPVQHPRPLAGRHRGPRPVGERAVRGPRRAIDIRGAAGGHLRVDPVAHRVGDGEGGPVRAR